MPPSTSFPLHRHPAFREGVRDMVMLALGIAAWGLVTGIAMVKGGLSVPMAVAMSLLVFAGSAQLAALPLMVAGAPIWVVWAAACCVNLRFVIFSVAWRPYFAHLPLPRRALHGYFSGDLNYVIFMKRFPEPRPAPEQEPYFWGAACTNWCAWQGASLTGIALANVIPPQWGLGFAGVLALTAVIAALLKDRTTWIAAGVAGAAAVAAFALPLKLHIVVAIAAAVAVALTIEAAEAAQRQARRDAATDGSGKERA